MSMTADTLQNICISYISENVDSVFTAVKDLNGNTIKYNFKNISLCFPINVCEQLFNAFNRNILTDQLLTIFDPSVTRLQRVYIRDASKVSVKGLRILRSHKIVELGVVGLCNATVNELIGCLGDWTLENLRVLNVANSTFLSPEKVRVIIALSKLQNLRHLNVSFTKINTHELEIVASDLPVLESLCIAGTLVTDITPLRKCKDRLKFLNMYNLKISNFHKFLNVLYEMQCLQHLDISEDRDDTQEFNEVHCGLLNEFFRRQTCLPALISLDISGKNSIESETIKIFLSNHPNMVFLGLLEVDACHDDIFTQKLSGQDSSTKLMVTGSATEQQALESLKRYVQRKFYLQRSLFYVYSYIQNLSDARIDIIELVLEGMKMYPYTVGIQVTATACLYNLTKGSLSAKIHPYWLKQIVDVTLEAMENFPKQQQLQKNTLLTLCSDRMLQDVSFNRYHCANLVMNSLLEFNEPAMNRMSVAICSILAARISTAETSNLGAKSTYMKKLLSIVQSKTEQRDFDIMMKFTLSALWNLTDESPRTCKMFLKLGGLQLFLEVLNVFAGESGVETKVLGLMNNLAEVAHLRPHLMQDNFISALKSLLRSQHIDVSYFAAGIVAHIASEGEEYWTCSSVSWNEMIDELGSAVLSWAEPEMEMVAYRSFYPFYPLFACLKTYPIQLWAAWAIHHVCSKNPRRYCSMMIQEGGVWIIRNLIDYPNIHESVIRICSSICEIVLKEFPNALNVPDENGVDRRGSLLLR